IPLQYVRNNSPFLTGLSFCHQIPQPHGQPTRRENIPFYSVMQTDSVFQSITTNFEVLPPRSPVWGTPVSAWNVFNDVSDLPLPDVHVIETPDEFVKTLSPVKASTTDRFTEEARAAAEDSDIALDLEDLEEMINEKNRKRYIEINTSFLNGKILRIQDPNGKLLSDVFTLPEHLYQKLKDAIALIQGAMPGEWKHDTSLREAYRFLSCHYSWYARYGEKGHTAPTTAAHMDHVQRGHGGRINFSQRTPHQSKEIRENAREYAVLCDAYEEVFDYIRVTLQKRFPDQYKGLSIYCDALPMNASSPCYPF
ncbi:hypothetical protein R3P38DRAFT_2441854, partial [Favolaschia claudopus]